MLRCELTTASPSLLTHLPSAPAQNRLESHPHSNAAVHVKPKASSRGTHPTESPPKWRDRQMAPGGPGCSIQKKRGRVEAAVGLGTPPAPPPSAPSPPPPLCLPPPTPQFLYPSGLRGRGSSGGSSYKKLKTGRFSEEPGPAPRAVCPPLKPEAGRGGGERAGGRGRSGELSLLSGSDFQGPGRPPPVPAPVSPGAGVFSYVLICPS